MNTTTDFTDKTGKSIHVGDILQLRLGKFAKSGGPTQVRVILHGKRVQIVDVDDVEHKYGGRNLTEQTAKVAVIVESLH